MPPLTVSIVEHGSYTQTQGHLSVTPTMNRRTPRRLLCIIGVMATAICGPQKIYTIYILYYTSVDLGSGLVGESVRSAYPALLQDPLVVRNAQLKYTESDHTYTRAY